MKTRSSSLCVFGQNCSAMRLANGAHNGKAHSQAVIFCGEELLEKSLTSCLRNSRAVVPHCNVDGAVAVVIRGKLYDPATGWRVTHGVEGIAHEIDHCLLNLNRIAFNGRKICCEGCLNLAKMRGGIRLNHVRDDFHYVIQIYMSANRSALLNRTSHIVHDVAGASTICRDVVKNILQLFRIESALLEILHCGGGVVHDCCQRLV